MKKKELAATAVEELKKLYPEAVCSLNYETPFQLLIATRLSAQCTDKRVNMVTPALFSRFPTAEEMAKADVSEIEELIKSCGLYKTKALSLKEIAKGIIDNFGGKVPDTIEELTTLSGVGRKTANLICGDIYGKPAIVTDTHFIRIMGRLSLTDSTNPLIVERQAAKVLDPKESNDFCHRIVLFGRDICKAINPKCEICPLNKVCIKKGVKK